MKSKGPAGLLGGSQSSGNQGGIDLPLPIFTQSCCGACLDPTLDFQGSPPMPCVRESSLCASKNHFWNTAALVPTPAWYKRTTLGRTDTHPFAFPSLWHKSQSDERCPFTSSIHLASALYVPKPDFKFYGHRHNLSVGLQIPPQALGIPHKEQCACIRCNSFHQGLLVVPFRLAHLKKWRSKLAGGNDDFPDPSC